MPISPNSIDCARDELLTRGLDDIEARVLINALVYRLDQCPQNSKQLLMKARIVSKIVELWNKGKRCGANQLAASEGIAEFLPIPQTDAVACMEKILLGWL